ncbi:hypothetical protein EVAR_99138_1 [Eumeta japonica]|uniref:Uncharacterized protein n=1 Tax=Eumeta variegata TaxID=151549 RepID=A0A4C1YEY1_EUMVA|nr:hypothetical protein EVAR_99138_1 [Eumeta japonica]
MNLAYSFKQICQESDIILRAHVLQGYLPVQTPEFCTTLTSPLDLQATDVLEAEVIFANLPEDESSINAQHNAECIMQLMSDDDETGYLDDMRLEPECNLIENALAALEGEIQLDEENQIHTVLGSKTWERSIAPLKIPG